MNREQLVKDSFDDSDTIIIIKIMRENRVSDLQQACNDNGSALIVDGIFGANTIRAIRKIGLDKVMLSYNKSNKNVQRETIMQFLYKVEGNTIHHLKGEIMPTSPYGVYAYAHPQAPVTKYMLSLYVKYGMNPRRRSHARRLNNIVNTSERERLVNLAWDFYSKEFMGSPAIIKALENYPKTSLALFSNSVNGGKKRGVRTLQYAMGVKRTGKINFLGISKLKRVLKRKGDINMRQDTLHSMANYYRYLIRKKSKFLEFARGWCNRLKIAGYKTGLKKCKG